MKMFVCVNEIMICNKVDNDVLSSNKIKGLSAGQYVCKVVEFVIQEI